MTWLKFNLDKIVVFLRGLTRLKLELKWDMLDMFYARLNKSELDKFNLDMVVF